MTFVKAATLVTLVVTATLLAGCNLFEPVFDGADNVEALLEDARAARANGDYPKAIELLELALAIEPSHPVVRFELGTTLLRRDRLDLTTLEQVTSHLISARGGRGAGGGSAGDGQVCTFPADAAIEPFDPREVDDFEQLSNARPTLVWVIELLNDPSSPGESPAMPPELTDLDVCEVLHPTGLDYDRQLVLDALLAQFESPEQVTGALVTNAVAQTLTSYVNLFEQPDIPVDWFIVDNTDVGACVAEADYDLFVGRARAEVQRAGEALISLDMLVFHTGNGHYEVIVDDAIEVYHILESEDVSPCPER